MSNFDYFMKLKEPYFHLVVGTESDLCNMHWRTFDNNEQNIVSKMIRGSKCKSVDSLFDEFSAAFQIAPLRIGINFIPLILFVLLIKKENSMIRYAHTELSDLQYSNMSKVEYNPFQKHLKITRIINNTRYSRAVNEIVSELKISKQNLQDNQVVDLFKARLFSLLVLDVKHGEEELFNVFSTLRNITTHLIWEEQEVLKLESDINHSDNKNPILDIEVNDNILQIVVGNGNIIASMLIKLNEAIE